MNTSSRENNFCIGCSKNIVHIDKNTWSNHQKELNINDLIQIFNNEIVMLLSDYNLFLYTCCNCLKQLEITYRFIQNIKNVRYVMNSIKSCLQVSNRKKEEENKEQEDIPKGKQISQIKTELTSYEQKKLRAILPKDDSNTYNMKQSVNKSCKLQYKTTRRLYKCYECNESFTGYKILQNHKIKHRTAHPHLDDVFIFICQQCHVVFNKEMDLMDHKKLVHVDGKFSCYPCNNRMYASKGFLLRHCNKKHKDNINYYCGYCKDSSGFKNSTEVKGHVLKTHLNNGEQSTSINSEHMQISLIEKEDEMNLEMHEEFLDEFLLAHNSNDDSFQFSECWKDLDLHFPDMLPIQQDISITKCQLNNPTENFPCVECTNQFKYPQQLIEHLCTFHTNVVLQKDSSGLICPYCNKLFKKLLQLKQHLRIVHARNKRHICQLCDKLFSTIDHLKKHVLSQHQNERKHICHVCAKGFTQLCHLRQHLAIHTTGKSFLCTHCSHSFWRKIDLERHKQNKHDEHE